MSLVALAVIVAVGAAWEAGSTRRTIFCWPALAFGCAAWSLLFRLLRPMDWTRPDIPWDAADVLALGLARFCNYLVVLGVVYFIGRIRSKV